MPMLDDTALDALFREARTFNWFLPTPVEEALLVRLYELARMGPTSANSQPLRVVFVRSPEAKARLEPTLTPSNREKTMAAPVTAILAADAGFAEHMPRLYPAWKDFGGFWNALTPEQQGWMLAQGGSLQAGYFILAARALGLDCGPMGGFDREKVNAAFFPDGRWKAQLLVNLGYGDRDRLRPRNPRLGFVEACRIE